MTATERVSRLLVHGKRERMLELSQVEPIAESCEPEAGGAFFDRVAAHGALICDEFVDEPTREIDLRLSSSALRAAVAALPERERRVIELRYAIGGGGPLSREALARMLELIRQIEKAALERLSLERELQAARGRQHCARRRNRCELTA